MVPSNLDSGATTVTNTTTMARLDIPRSTSSVGPEKIPAWCTIPDVRTVISVVRHMTVNRINAARASARLCSSGCCRVRRKRGTATIALGRGAWSERGFHLKQSAARTLAENGFGPILAGGGSHLRPGGVASILAIRSATSARALLVAATCPSTPAEIAGCDM